MEWILPQNLQRDPTLPTPWFQTFDSRKYENRFLLSDCANVLWQLRKQIQWPSEFHVCSELLTDWPEPVILFLSRYSRNIQLYNPFIYYWFHIVQVLLLLYNLSTSWVQFIDETAHYVGASKQLMLVHYSTTQGWLHRKIVREISPVIKYLQISHDYYQWREKWTKLRIHRHIVTGQWHICLVRDKEEMRLKVRDKEF